MILEVYKRKQVCYTSGNKYHHNGEHDRWDKLPQEISSRANDIRGSCWSKSFGIIEDA